MASEPSQHHSQPSSRIRRILLLVILYGLVLRLPYFWSPFVDGHSYRQIDTAAIARNFYETSFVPFDPQVDWGGRHGYVEAEFPAVPAFVAVLYRIFGFHEWFGRIVVLPFAVGLMWMAYLLTTELDGRPATGLAAAFFVAVSPLAAFFGRVLMPDTPMVFFSMLALFAYVRFARTDSTTWLWLGSAAMALACLIKLPAIFIGPAIAVAVVHGRGWVAFRDRRVWYSAIAPLLVIIAWYVHAHDVFQQTGLTFGVSTATSGTYPPSISPGPWPAALNKWSTRAMLQDWGFYDLLFRRFYHLIWTPTGFVLAIIGFALSRQRVISGVWFASMALFVLMMGGVHTGHEYYQLPFVPIGAVWFGAAAWPAFDLDWIRAHAGRRIWQIAGFAMLVAAVGLVSFYQSGVMRNFYEPHGMAVHARDVGRQIDDATPDNSLAIVVDDYGTSSPMLLYFAHLKGWSFETTTLSPELVNHLRDMGARYFVTTQYGQVEGLRPGVAQVLSEFASVPLPGNPRDARVIDLHQRRSVP